MSPQADDRRRVLAAGLFYLVAVGAYSGSGRLVVGRSVAIPTLHLDEWIPFEPGFAPLYLGYFPYMAWLLWRLVHSPDWVGPCVAAGSVVGLSLLCFLIWPTHVDRALPTAAGFWDEWVRTIQRVDPSTNALPSLHASLTVLGSYCAARRGLLPAWVALAATGLILYSALALKQHLALDIACGALLGAGAALIVERRPGRRRIA